METKISDAIERAQDKEWEILPSTDKNWFRWKEGKDVRAGCTIMGAVLMTAVAEITGDHRNFMIPPPKQWIGICAHYLGVQPRWVLIFLKGQGDPGAVDITFHPFDEEDSLAFGLGQKFNCIVA